MLYLHSGINVVRRVLDKCDLSGLLLKENDKLPVYCKGNIFLGELNKSPEAPHDYY